MAKGITPSIIITTETIITTIATIAIIVTTIVTTAIIVTTTAITATTVTITIAIIIEIITTDITTILSMAINIAVFVPAGIVIGSDNLAFQRNEDDGAMFEGSVSTFAIHNKFLLSFVGDGFINEKPYDYYVENISIRSSSISFPNVHSFDQWLSLFWREEKCIMPTYYLAGFDIENDVATPIVLLCENGNSILVNNNGEQQVYYYHSCGKNEWIEKILLDTYFEDHQTREKIELQPALINFPKFNIKMAVSFISLMLKFSAQFYSFCSIRNIGCSHTIFVVTPTGTYEA